jgi:hypothetical protein
MNLSKRIVFAAVLILCAGMLFAQAGENKNAVTPLDLMPLLKGFIASDLDSDTFHVNWGIAYERRVAPYFGIGVKFDIYPGLVNDLFYFYLGMSLTGRYYPLADGKIEGFFIGAHIGFNVQSIDFETDSAYGGFFGLFAGLETGWRVQLGKMFFIEPAIAFNYSKSNMVQIVPLGWQGGLRVGVSF